MSEELKNCPFCGVAPKYSAAAKDTNNPPHGWPDQVIHNCKIMDTQMLVRGDSKDEVFQKWNTRAEGARELLT